MLLHLPQLGVVVRKVHHVRTWDFFRHLLISRLASQTLVDVIPECVKAATTVVFLPVLYPSPDLNFLAFLSASWRLQWRGRRSGDRAQWQECRRVAGAYVPNSYVVSSGTSFLSLCHRKLRFPKYGELPGQSAYIRHCEIHLLHSHIQARSSLLQLEEEFRDLLVVQRRSSPSTVKPCSVIGPSQFSKPFYETLTPTELDDAL